MTATSAATTSTTPFGALLRYWRGVRRVSQLQLAVQAGISSRHVSFMETGRSTPSREMVLQVAEVLEVPLRERNSMLQAAGYASAFRESSMESAELEAVRKSLEFLLERHHPHPAIVVDRHWDILLQNRATSHLLSRFVAQPASFSLPLNAMRLLFRQEGIRPFVVNWDELSATLLHRLRREVAMDPGDEQSAALLAEAVECCGGDASRQVTDLAGSSSVIVEMHLRREDVELRIFSAITTLGTPLDITLQELRLETFFPADAASQRVIEDLVEA